MLRALLWLSVLLFAHGAALAQQARVVTIAVDEAHPPYVSLKDGQVLGVYVSLLAQAMHDMPGWKLRLLPRPWVRAVQEAQQGLVDGFLPPYRNASRDWVGAYIGPLMHEDVVLSCNANQEVGPEMRWPEDFAKRRIGTMRGYLLGREFSDPAQRSQPFTQREFRSTRDALAALANGDIDCYANDRLDIEFAHAEARADRVWAGRVARMLEPPYLLWSQPAFLALGKPALARRPELAEFAQELNARVARMRSNGELHKLLEESLRPRR